MTPKVEEKPLTPQQAKEVKEKKGKNALHYLSDVLLIWYKCSISGTNCSAAFSHATLHPKRTR